MQEFGISRATLMETLNKLRVNYMFAEYVVQHFVCAEQLNVQVANYSKQWFDHELW